MNAVPLLKEILQALRDFRDRGEEHTIYISKIPLTEEDRELLLDTLGRGCVTVRYSSVYQPAEWRETAIHGVWIGTIYNRDGKPVLETIEITDFPRLAASQREDIEESLSVLAERISCIETGKRHDELSKS